MKWYLNDGDDNMNSGDHKVQTEGSIWLIQTIMKQETKTRQITLGRGFRDGLALWR